MHLFLRAPHALKTMLVLSAVLIWAAPLRADDWPQLLGPQRNGISAETGLLESWPPGGPPEVWRVPGGVGMSAVSVASGRAVTMVQREGKQIVVALDARRGEVQWETPVAPEFKNTMGDGPRATPTWAGDRLYVYTGEGVLACLQTKDGAELWRRSAVAEYKGKPADYGMACSPLVVGDLVVVIVGAPGPTVVAYRADNGAPVWKAGSDPAGYSSPVLRNVGGREQLLVFSGKSVLALDPPTGKQLWRYPYVTEYDCNIAVPLAVDGNVFISCGENHGAALLKLAPESDVFRVEEVWISEGPESVMRNEWQTSILRDGYLYGFDNIGSAGPVTHFTCVEAATGKKMWEKLRFGKGNAIAADGKLFMSTHKGELILARATPQGYQELGRAAVIGPTRQAPSLAEGLLYLRDDREIVCFDVRAK
jgi:outer membrane protein assembly factor BamB